MINTCLTQNQFNTNFVLEHCYEYDFIAPFIFVYHQTLEGKKDFAVKLKQARMRAIRGKIAHTLEKNIEYAA